MKAHLPGSWRNGGARIDTSECEMANAIPPDPDRRIAPAPCRRERGLFALGMTAAVALVAVGGYVMCSAWASCPLCP